MATVASEIRALTASSFRAPEKFVAFCRNGGKPLGGIIDGEESAGSMNATFQTIDPGSQETLATICEMGEAEVSRAVSAAGRAFQDGWKNLDLDRRIALVRRLVELCERDRDGWELRPLTELARLLPRLLARLLARLLQDNMFNWRRHRLSMSRYSSRLYL